jgi:hypothetical protein
MQQSIPAVALSRRMSAVARLLRQWVRILPGSLRFVVSEFSELSVVSLCDELITRPEEFYGIWFVVVCDLETPSMKMSWPAMGRSTTNKSVEQAHFNQGNVNFLYFVLLIVCFNTSCMKYSIRLCPVVYLRNMLNKHTNYF